MNTIEALSRPAGRLFVITYLLFALPTLISAQKVDAHVGTWELNLQKSTFNPGPPPQKQTLSYKAEGRGLSALLQGIDATGRPTSPDAGNFSIIFDGKDHATPQPTYDSSVWTRENDRRYVVQRKKAGKVVSTSTNVVSDDGQTLTITTVGADENGQQVRNVRVYDRR